MNDTKLKIKYIITVINNGEIAETADVIEKIPEYFNVTDGTNSNWELQDNNTYKLSVSLHPGESKQYNVVIEWNKDQNVFGTRENTVQLENVKNDANYDETTKEDNYASAEVIVEVKIGLNKNIMVVLLILSVLLISGGIIIKSKRKLDKKEK